MSISRLVLLCRRAMNSRPSWSLRRCSTMTRRSPGDSLRARPERRAHGRAPVVLPSVPPGRAGRATRAEPVAVLERPIRVSIFRLHLGLDGRPSHGAEPRRQGGWVLAGGVSASYRDPVLRWQSRAAQHINGNRGYVPGTVEHRFHVRKADRGYLSRWDIIVRRGSGPAIDLNRTAMACSTGPQQAGTEARVRPLPAAQERGRQQPLSPVTCRRPHRNTEHAGHGRPDRKVAHGAHLGTARTHRGRDRHHA